MSLKLNEDTYSYRCFICWDDIDFEDTSTKIVSACNCISTDFKYTHKDCLNLWVNQNRHAGLKCQVCGTRFHIKRVLKPFKKIYKENWKRINCLILTMILVNSLLWMLCIQWSKDLEKYIDHCNEETELGTLAKYDDWISNYDERETYIEEFINQFNLSHIFQNIYLNITVLFIFINASIILLYFYHEKDKFIEYSIDENYEYRKNTTSKYFKNHKNDTYSMIPENNVIYNNREYQKIRII